MSFIPVNEPRLDGNEKKYLAECIDTGWISWEGAFVKRLEREFAERVGRKHAVSVSNGTTALELAVQGLGIGPGDEVIIPAFTIISCAAAVVRAGAVPVLADSDPITWNMQVGRLEERITPRTKAVMAVHLYGLPTDMDPLLDLAQRKGLSVIEDAAQAIGLKYRNRECGGFGDVSTMSFFPNKHVTTGEGGMVFCDDDALADRLRSLRNLCFQPLKKFEHECLGFNFRMSNLQAAVGCAQLERLDETIEKKRWIGRTYDRLLGELPGVRRPVPETEYSENIYWVYGLVPEPETGLDADTAMARLKQEGIGSRAFFWPMHEQPALKKLGLFQNERHPVAESLARQGFYLPTGLTLDQERIARVAAAVRRMLGLEATA